MGVTGGFLGASPAAWLFRTAVSLLVSVLGVGATVYVVGDRLLTHALGGYASGISDIRVDIDQLRTEVRGVGDGAIQRFIEALERNQRLEVRVTGDFEQLATRMDDTNKRLDELLQRVGSTNGELAELQRTLQANAVEQARIVERLNLLVPQSPR